MAIKKRHLISKPVLELTQGKPRVEEEKFFVKFSETQLNVILLIILSATFLVQGIIKYLEAVQRLALMRPWFILILLALAFLVCSVVFISFGGIFSKLKTKRWINVISFFLFILGVVVFLMSLLFLLFNL